MCVLRLRDFKLAALVLRLRSFNCGVCVAGRGSVVQRKLFALAIPRFAALQFALAFRTRRRWPQCFHCGFARCRLICWGFAAALRGCELPLGHAARTTQARAQTHTCICTGRTPACGEHANARPNTHACNAACAQHTRAPCQRGRLYIITGTNARCMHQSPKWPKRVHT